MRVQSTREFRTWFRALPAVVMVAALATVAGTARAGARTPPLEARVDTTALPVAKDTRSNLQAAFDGETNARARYEAAAKVADREGYPYVAVLMRACARAEQVHADDHVHAIAWTGDEARAYLAKLALGTTAENLRVAIEKENDEAGRIYPAMLAQARSDHMAAAVRSMNYALAAEREHAALLADALATLDQRPPVHPFYVCPGCGRTVARVASAKCTNCFTPRAKFIRVD